MGELNEQTETNTDRNSLCELPEGHKGLHERITPDGYSDLWTGYARHSSEPTETKTVTIGEAKDTIRTMIEDISQGLDWPANNWPAHWRQSDEVFASPFSSHTEPSVASNKP